MEMIELYLMGSKEARIKTTKGTLNYFDWLKQERDRINSDPDRLAEIRESKTGSRASLWVDIADNYYVRVRR